MRNFLAIGLLAFSVTPSAPIERKPPEALSLTKRILCDGRWRGHGIPTGSNTLATVGHVIDGCTVIGWEDDMGHHGTFIVLRRKTEQRPNEYGVPTPYRDYALLLSDTQFNFWAVVKKRVPKNGEILYSAVVLPGTRQLFGVSGPFVGVDGWGHWETDMTSHPGSSGVPVMDAEGNVLALNNGAYGANFGRALGWATPVSQIFD